MNTHPVHRSTIAVWRCHAFAASFALLIAVTIVSLVARRYLWPAAPIMFALAAAVFAWRWPAVAHRHLRFGVDESGIVIERGVFFRSRIALPRVRIQHTDVSQGPLQRRFGVGTLKLYTAGSAHTKIELPGLAHQDAVELRDMLLADGKGSGV